MSGRVHAMRVPGTGIEQSVAMQRALADAPYVQAQVSLA